MFVTDFLSCVEFNYRSNSAAATIDKVLTMNYLVIIIGWLASLLAIIGAVFGITRNLVKPLEVRIDKMEAKFDRKFERLDEKIDEVRREIFAIYREKITETVA